MRKIYNIAKNRFGGAASKKIKPTFPEKNERQFSVLRRAAASLLFN